MWSIVSVTSPYWQTAWFRALAAAILAIVDRELQAVDGRLDHADGNHFEAGYLLQLVEIGFGELTAVDRRLGAEIVEWSDGHARKLRERIVNHRLMGDLGQ